MEAITRALAHQLRRRDVTVNAVALGHESSGHPDSVADLVAFLVSDDGHRLSGQVIPADGEIIVAAYDNEDHERAPLGGAAGTSGA